MGAQTSIFRYPGGKSKLIPQLAPYLHSLLENQTSFLDLFVGGGSILIWVAQNYPHLKLFANDKNYDLSCFWSIIANENPYLIQELKTKLNVHPTLDLFYRIKETNFEIEDIVNRAFKVIFLNRTSFSGIGINPIGGKNQISKYKVDCRYNYSKIIKHIDFLHSLLKNRLSVWSEDFSQLSIFINDQVPTYLDPPYYIAGDQLYQQSMVELEHIALSKILQNKYHWVLSYDDHPFIKDLYSQQKINFLQARYSVDGKKNNWKQKQELVITPNV